MNKKDFPTSVLVALWATQFIACSELGTALPQLVIIFFVIYNLKLLPSSALASTPTLVEAEVSFNINFSTPPTHPTHMQSMYFVNQTPKAKIQTSF